MSPSFSSTEKTVVIVGFMARGNTTDVAAQAQRTLKDFAATTTLDLSDEPDLEAREEDLFVVLGGDGSILQAARLMGRRQKPVLGVNLGRLGFLADLLPGELQEVAPRLFSEETAVVEHLMLECTLFDGDEVVACELGLNEVALRAGAPFRILEIEAYIDDLWATTYSCDGLVFSTPVGSTAHSLSAGGPILRKDLQAFVITPLNPHTLTNRPVVDSADRVYEFAVAGEEQSATVVIDGRELGELSGCRRASIRRAEPRFQLIEAPGHTYYRTLREKLHWRGGSVDPRPKESVDPPIHPEQA